MVDARTGLLLHDDLGLPVFDEERVDDGLVPDLHDGDGDADVDGGEASEGVFLHEVPQHGGDLVELEFVGTAQAFGPGPREAACAPVLDVGHDLRVAAAGFLRERQPAVALDVRRERGDVHGLNPGEAAEDQGAVEAPDREERDEHALLGHGAAREAQDALAARDEALFDVAVVAFGHGYKKGTVSDHVVASYK